MQSLRGRALLPKQQKSFGCLGGSHSRGRRLSLCLARASSHYDVLGVSPNANAADIKSAYRYAARRLHPDVNRQPGAHEAFVECARAYEVLGDQNSRRAYDADLRAKAASSARRSAASPFSSASPRSAWSSSSRWTGNPYYTVEYETWTGPSSSSRHGFGSMWSSFDSFDESDSSDEDDDYELDYELWATSDHNYSSSFTSSWQVRTLEALLLKNIKTRGSRKPCPCS
ncbi:DnaJ domain-containing protein [Dunaliella salina]|uniref:DnaJ domain-containing protein n=1 Tax=Dunaliella salina TaxID=3046 RepID=A0ABQ7G7X2_DUNSA|nr:DnaJ domain-containing protein [Dunaliella salina]|eukprot:KAF5830703.1 DnaJ domain-containing protein [Dunaliella salina]